MTPGTENTSGSPDLSKAASELNNLLQIISGTSARMEEQSAQGKDMEKYMAMLRDSIERAEKITADLALQAGGANKKKLLQSEFTPFLKTKPASDAGMGKESIMLVDDEKMTLTLVKRVLTDAGYNVATAQSGFECIDQFRRRPTAFDLVILDLTMPFMDGEETFARLRELRSDMPVILCTGFIQQERLERLMESGLAGFLRKPVAPDEIVSVVRTTLQTVRFSGGAGGTRTVG